MDVKKIGRIPDGGGWSAHGRQPATTGHRRGSPRSASTTSTPWSTTTPGGPTPRSCRREGRHLCGVPHPRRRLLRRPRHHPHRAGHDRQPPGYRRSTAVTQALAELGAQHMFIKPHCPWQNGKVERTTAPCRSNGPTGRSSSPTPNEQTPLRPGWSSTTLDADTPHSAARPRSADCHQPDGRVHLGPPISGES